MAVGRAQSAETMPFQPCFADQVAELLWVMRRMLMWRSRRQRRRLSTLVRPVNQKATSIIAAFSRRERRFETRRPCVWNGRAHYDGQGAQADAAIGHLDGFIHALEKLEEQERFDNGEVVLKEPIGVCGLITPWGGRSIRCSRYCGTSPRGAPAC